MQRLAARLTGTTRLAPAEAVEAIRRVCDDRYLVHAQSDIVLIGYEPCPAAMPITDAPRPRRLPAGHWLAALRFARDEPGSDEPGREEPRSERPVELRLTNWVIDSEGRRESRERYEDLTAAIWEAVAAP